MNGQAPEMWEWKTIVTDYAWFWIMWTAIAAGILYHIVTEIRRDNRLRRKWKEQHHSRGPT